MRVSLNADSPSGPADKDPKAAKRKHTSVVTKSNDSKSGGAAQSSKKESAKETPPAKPDSEVTLSAKGKEQSVKPAAGADKKNTKAPTPKDTSKEESAQTESRDLGDAETLMDHVNAGNLSPDERNLALKRVGEIIKRYGNA